MQANIYDKITRVCICTLEVCPNEMGKFLNFLRANGFSMTERPNTWANDERGHEIELNY